MSQVLELVTGQSAFGWSKIGSFNRCPRMFALSRDKKKKKPSKALIAGSLIHEAMALIMIKNSGYSEILERFKAYINEFHDSEDDSEIVQEALKIAEETVQKMLLENQHLWLFQKFHNFQIEWELSLHEINNQVLEFPITSRIDAIVESRKTGGIWFIDHKTTSFRDETATFANVLHGYMIDGQFKLQTLIGKENFGDKFQGIILNFINKKGKENGRTYAYRLPPYSPEQLDDFSSMLLKTLRKIKLAQENNNFPMVHNQMLCTHKFGTCEYFNTCHDKYDTTTLKINL